MIEVEVRFNSDTKVVLKPQLSKEKDVLSLALREGRCVKVELAGEDWVLTFIPKILPELKAAAPTGTTEGKEDQEPA